MDKQTDRREDNNPSSEEAGHSKPLTYNFSVFLYGNLHETWIYETWFTESDLVSKSQQRFPGQSTRNAFPYNENINWNS